MLSSDGNRFVIDEIHQLLLPLFYFIFAIHFIFKNMFDNLSEKIDKALHLLKGHGSITEINVAETLKEVRRALVDADVNLSDATLHYAEFASEDYTTMEWSLWQ